MDKRYEYCKEERAVLEHTKVPLAIYQFVEKRVATLILSDGFLDLFGYDSREEAYKVAETNMYRDTHPDDVARIAEIAHRFSVEGGTYEVLYRSLNRDRTGYNVLHGLGEHVVMPDGSRVAQVWYTDEGPYVEGTKLEKADLNMRLNKALHEESILSAGYFDHLTGLPSMTYFFELAEAGRDAFLAEGKEPVLLFMDLSGMKFFNHEYGFAEGNRLLAEFAKLLIKFFGADYSSRYGEDHFVVLTYEDDIENRLFELFEEVRNLNNGNSLPVRVGIYANRMGEVDSGTACDRAKFACDSIPNTYGSNYRFFNEDMKTSAEHRQYVVSNFDLALEEKWITVYYQPIVRTVNGKVCDEEALARWIDPERGVLSPAEFIPILEDTGLIWRLDLYMLERVLEKLLNQKNAGLHMVPQSVNLSRTDFDACDVVEEIRKRVDDAGIPRDLITIEITESVIGKDFGFMRTQISRFVDLGFPVWLDDFGSGYSSLDLLQSIKFNLIKFDMRFMQQFDNSQSSRIVLTELMKMASALGTDTICEGVENENQVQFLREIGCTKIQGYYYQKPIPWEKVLEKYEEGRQIGFEDPRELEYYEALGSVNLYDLSVIAQEEDDVFHNFFNSLPMGVMEIIDDKVYFVRSNQPYRDFMKRLFGYDLSDPKAEYESNPFGSGRDFMNLVNHCCRHGNRAIFDQKLADGSVVHSFIRRLATNPVTGAVSVVFVILSVEDPLDGIKYEDIANVLAADYFNLFYVNLDTDEFTEYTSGIGEEEISMERHGEHFFDQTKKDALHVLYPEDQQAFLLAFTKEKLINGLKNNGTFNVTYRQMINDEPVYVSMKARLMRGNNAILAVSNADAEMKQKSTLKRIRDDQVAYNRLTALSDEYLVLYTVDYESDRYAEYSTNEDYNRLGLEKVGYDFFKASRENGKRVIYKEDLPLYLEKMTRENVLKEINENGRFLMRYRLMINGEPKPVSLRGAIVEESDGKKIIMGVVNDERK